MIKFKELKVLQFIAFVIFLNVSSCCVFKTDPADLRISSQTFPSQVTVGQRFNVSFTVGNYSNTDCNSEATTQSIVNLKMRKQSNQFLQVNNT
ncbi:MAG: hypothetical protein LH629_07095, partial [Ignavibacteria bacterium]|nr:hypothetical protein [Ignavibacteria bacterium]